jgi:hypothetical protein
MIPLTPELEQKIKNNGGSIIYVTLEEFQEIMSEGEVLTSKQVKEQFNIYNKK